MSEGSNTSTCISPASTWGEKTRLIKCCNRYIPSGGCKNFFWILPLKKSSFLIGSARTILVPNRAIFKGDEEIGGEEVSDDDNGEADDTVEGDERKWTEQHNVPLALEALSWWFKSGSSRMSTGAPKCFERRLIHSWLGILIKWLTSCSSSGLMNGPPRVLVQGTVLTK